jgi:ligand-binding sensor domain-containing protein
MLITTIAGGFWAFGQQPYLWHLSDEDGLPSNEVYQIFQDKKGYIWMGTDNGVARYDGLSFKVLSCEGQQGRAISYLNEDSKGRIWCINFSGQIFWIENDSLHLLKGWSNYQKSNFPTISIDDKDRLWISSKGNDLILYDIEKKKFKELKVGTTSSNQINTVFCNKSKTLIVDLKRGPMYLADSLFKPIPFAPIQDLRLSYNGFEFSSQLGGSVFLLSKSEKVVYELRKDVLLWLPINHHLLKHSSNINNILRLPNGEIYVPTYDGLLYFQNSTSKPELFLKGEQVSFVTKDKEGNLWISTLKNGVYVMPNRNLSVINSQNSALQNSIPAYLVSDGKGSIYCSQNSGYVSVIDARSGAVKKVIDVGFRKDCEMLQYDAGSGRLFTTYDQLFEINSQGKMETVKPKIYNVKGVSVDINNNLIVADPTTFFITNQKQNKNISEPYLTPIWLRNFKWKAMGDTTKPDAPYRMLLANQRTRSLFHDAPNKTIWVSFTNGIWYFKNGEKHQLLDEKGKEIVAYRFASSPDGSIWAGTTNHGLICIKNNQVVKRLTTANGLLSNFVKSVSTSSKGVWFFAETGVQFYDFATGKISSFTRADGLIGTDVTDVLAAGGKVWICASRGIQFFPDNFLLNNTTPPLVYIAGIAIAEHDTLLKDSLVLAFNQNNIRIAISGLSYSSRGHFKYKYRLLGLDTNWITVESRNNFARFPSLPAGHYIFEVVAMNEDGLCSRPAKLHFTIQKPYWLRWWFILLMLVLIATIIYLVYHYRINSVKRQAKLLLDKTFLEQNLRASELTALKAQMNPHFIFNALNSIQDFILLNDKQAAQQYLGKFSDLMRLYLDMSQRQSISLEDEIKSLRLYLDLESIRFKDTFTFELNVDDNIDLQGFQIPPMIIQPYIENALKHGLLHKKTERRLSIHFGKKDSNTLECTIVDNGIGRQASMGINSQRVKKFSSFSSGATARRLELLNQGRPQPIGVTYEDLMVNSVAMGTKVVVTLPG